MSERNPNPGDTEENGDAGSTSDEYEVERPVTRETGAAALRRLADGVANGSVELGGDEGVTATVPGRFALKLEYEQGAEAAELEAELAWPIGDGEAVAADGTSEPPERDDVPDSEEDDVEPADADETGGGDSATESDAGASIADVIGAGGAASNARFELFRDRADEWRWRLVHHNGNIIADSGEGYDRKATARNGLESVMRNAPGAAIVEDVE